MSITSIGVSTCTVALLIAGSMPAARGQELLESRTEFTFSGAVELPGITLPAGTYVFRFADQNGSRSVMHVFQKEKPWKTYGLFVTAYIQRPEPSDDAEIHFMETPSGHIPAIRTWWFPGNSTGREFIYPKEQARRLAMLTHSRVLTTASAADKASGKLAYILPTGEESAAFDRRSH
jgi:hypothetical protein